MRTGVHARVREGYVDCHHECVLSGNGLRSACDAARRGWGDSSHSHCVSSTPQRTLPRPKVTGTPAVGCFPARPTNCRGRSLRPEREHDWPHDTQTQATQARRSVLPLVRSPWLQPFADRIMNAVQEPTDLGDQPPESLVPWWQESAMGQLRPHATPRPTNIHGLVYSALHHSPYVRGISKTPVIREYGILEAEADFDITSFVESRFLDSSEPVGNTLTTGGPSRFRDHDWDYSAGIRKRAWRGGTVELSQQLGYQDNNSNFFAPTQQGTSRLSLSFTQPFLRGRGRAYNTALIVLAEIDTQVGWDQFSEQLQEHLLDVTKAYWNLYLGRASLQQQRRHFRRAQDIYHVLQGRRGIDALESQIAMAHAAVETRRAALARSETTVPEC